VAAAVFFKEGVTVGAQYYCLARDRHLEMEQCLSGDGEKLDPNCFACQGVAVMLPTPAGACIGSTPCKGRSYGRQFRPRARKGEYQE
jgi:hypothetical protein